MEGSTTGVSRGVGGGEHGPGRNAGVGPSALGPAAAELAAMAGPEAGALLAPRPGAARRAGPPYRRIVLKLSGEVLAGKQGFGIDQAVVARIAGEVRDVAASGVQVAVVVGGGNFWRGASASLSGMDRATADYIGMLGTCINALAFQDVLESQGVESRVQTAIEMRAVAEPYIRRRAIRHLEKGRVVIFAAGTGNPFFSTDTAGALRAAEIEADVMLKATKETGIYDRDPRRDPAARLLRTISYDDFLRQHLGLMDAAAVSLCMENRIPIIVFDLFVHGNIGRAARGEVVGTVVGEAAAVVGEGDGGSGGGGGGGDTGGANGRGADGTDGTDGTSATDGGPDADGAPQPDGAAG